jgi:TetR/AcrR family transcriptional regulator
MESPESNRDLILATSLRLFAERGYEAVGVAELSEASGVTKPTLYHYFGSKRGLLDAIVAERGGPLLRQVKEASASVDPGDVPLGLERIADTMTKAARADPDFARLRLCLAFAPPASEGGAAAVAFNAELFGLLETYFAAAATRHGNMRGRSRAYAGTFIGTVDTYVGFYLAGQSTLDEAVLHGFVRQFMYGIFS